MGLMVISGRWEGRSGSRGFLPFQDIGVGHAIAIAIVAVAYAGGEEIGAGCDEAGVTAAHSIA